MARPTAWQALTASFRRFATREVPGAEVRADVGPDSHQVQTDDEGYFRIDVPTPASDATGTPRVSLSLPAQPDARRVVPIQVPGACARFGVISDVDDTIMVTHATSVLRMVKLTLFGSVASRVAFDGVAAFYGALHAGVNPFFYVSSSPWNLHGFLTAFLRHHGIVEGPLLLRDFGIDDAKFVVGPHREHKLAAIREVLDRHEALPFVLVGDSGQKDPEIYAQIVRENPARILAIYVRDVSGAAREREVIALVASVAEAGVDMLLVPDTQAAAEHARSTGLIASTVA